MFSDKLGVTNPCKDTNPGLANLDCTQAVEQAIEQAGANITHGFVGRIDASATPPITVPYHKTALCPVNVHWHLGAEHLSVGQFDEGGSGPDDAAHRRLRARKLAGTGTREGHQCHHYDASDPKFTTPYTWKHCVDTKVGQTYEVHWPHSAVGDCGTPWQYQHPFYDGVFCHFVAATGGSISPADQAQAVGVQGQIFTIVNDESYYYPDLIKGMLVAGAYGQDVAYYTGSTTGTSRQGGYNVGDQCSAYSPITWQVDRKCHMISASSFDKMCADMKAQADDMSDDLYPHGSRETVNPNLAAAQHVR